MAVAIGNYMFSDIDVRTTLLHADDLLALSAGTPARAERRARVAAIVGGLDPMQADLDELEPRLAAVWPELMAARDDLAAAGQLPPTATGTVVQLNRSGGGVPKRAVGDVEIDFAGVVGDRQRTRRHHGRPWQALCLWAAEVIDGFAAEGHPIFPGAAGENVTVAGIEWAVVQPGVRLRVGSALCEVSSYAVPCFNLKPFFADADFQRIHYSNGPISRVYATVLEPGAAAVGDAVVLEP